jgi:hypothetical protein
MFPVAKEALVSRQNTSSMIVSINWTKHANRFADQAGILGIELREQRISTYGRLLPDVLRE